MDGEKKQMGSRSSRGVPRGPPARRRRRPEILRVRVSPAKSNVTRSSACCVPRPRTHRSPAVGETGDAGGGHGGALAVGTDVGAIVLEVDSSGRRIRLSREAVLDAREAEEVREYTERADVTPPEGFGSLADKLRGALKPREK